MKKLICAALALMLLCGCTGGEETVPSETASAQTTAPAETTVPAGTTVPPETAGTVPAADPNAPISAEYAPETFNAYHIYWTDETDYITSIGFTAAEELTDVTFARLGWEGNSYSEDEVLYTIDIMGPETPFLAQVVYWGDMTTYGISFTDAGGARRYFAVYISGGDGSLVCTEYTP